MLDLAERNERNRLRTLCEKVCDDKMFVTRITNSILRVGISTVEEFMEADIDALICKVAGFYGKKN